MLKSLHQEWQRSRAQLDANPRLQWGLWAMLLLLLCWLNLVLSDMRSEQQSQLDELHLALADQQTLASQSVWSARLTQAKKALDEQAKAFGVADSDSLARADIQTQVAEKLAQLGLSKTRIDVSTAPNVDPATGLIPLQLRLNGQAQGDQLMALLEGLEQAQPAARITHLAVSNQQGKYLNYNLLATVWYLPWGRS